MAMSTRNPQSSYRMYLGSALLIKTSDDNGDSTAGLFLPSLDQAWRRLPVRLLFFYLEITNTQIKLKVTSTADNGKCFCLPFLTLVYVK